MGDTVMDDTEDAAHSWAEKAVGRGGRDTSHRMSSTNPRIGSIGNFSTENGKFRDVYS